MPSSIVAAGIGGLIAGTEIVAGELILGFSMKAFATSLIMSGLSAALAPDAPDQSQSSIESAGRTVTVRQAITPWRVIYGEGRYGGVITYKKSKDGYYHLILTFAGHVCHAVTAIYFGDELVPLDGSGNATGTFADHVRIKVSLGDESGQPFPDLVTESGGEWTDAHRQTGRTKIYVRLKRNPDLFPQGVPNITAVIQGKCDIYDPRSATRGYTANAALCEADYLTEPVIGVGADYATAINAPRLIASANVCDETVALAAGGSEPRYAAHGAFATSEKPADILPKLASAMAGHVVRLGGRWDIIAGAYDTPTVELTASDLAGPLAWQALVSRRDNCNGVKGVYVEPGNLWQPTDFPALQSAAYLAEDQGVPAWHDLRLEFTASAATAQRIAKIDLLRTRQPLTVSFPGKLSAFRALPGRTVLLTLAKYGWAQKPFFVESGRFTVGGDADGNPVLGYALGLRETAAACYDWTTSEEQAVDLAPNTDLGNPFVIDPPGAPAVTESLYETSGSAGVKARATIWLVPSPDSLAADILPEYRLADGPWIALPPTQGDRADVDDIAPGLYEFRCRYRNGLGQCSAHGESTVREITGLASPPATPSGLTAVAREGLLWARWDLSPDLDVRIGGRAVVRHARNSAAIWADGVPCDEFPGDASMAPLPLIAGTYLLKFRDSTGHWSEGTASFEPSAAQLTGWSDVGTVTEHAAFAGTHAGTEVAGGVLRLAAAMTIDDIATPIDDWSDFDTLGGHLSAVPAGSYTFAAVLDLGTAAPRRFEAWIEALSYDMGDTVDARLSAIDQWDDIDGAEVNGCTATMMIRVTPDNPAGTPVWSPWQPFLQGDFDCRAAQFRLDLASANSAHNIAVSALAVTARVPA